MKPGFDINREIHGVKLRAIRKFLRERPGDIHAEDMAKVFKLNDETARSLMAELCNEGFIEPLGYRIAPKGLSLRTMNLLKRIPRKKAVKIVMNLGKVIRESRTHFKQIYEIERLYIFGSYLDKEAQDLGDIDICVSLTPRSFYTDNLVKANIARAEEVGPVSLNSIEKMGYGEIEIKQMLCKVSPYISIHDEAELKELEELTGVPAKKHLFYSLKGGINDIGMYEGG